MFYLNDKAEEATKIQQIKYYIVQLLWVNFFPAWGVAYVHVQAERV